MLKTHARPPFHQGEVEYPPRFGIHKEGSLIDLGVTDGIIQKSGKWYAFNDERLGQGRENVRRALIDDPELYRNIENRILEKHGLAPETPQPASEPSSAKAAKAADSKA